MKLSRALLHLAVFALLSIGVVAIAASPPILTIMGAGGVTATASYTGPGDIVSGASAWYGLRGYSTAYSTGSNKALNIRRASDSTTQDINILTDGTLDLASAATFAGTDATCTGTIASTTLTLASCASGTAHVNDEISGAGINQPSYIAAIGSCATPPGTCTLNATQTVSVSETITLKVALFVAKVYDQSGNARDASQATAASQPQLLSNCAGGLPCTLYKGSQSLVDSSPLSSTTKYTTSAVGERTGAFTSFGSLIAGTGTLAGFGSAANTAIAYAGTSLTKTASDSVLHAFQFMFNGTSSNLQVDDAAVASGTVGGATLGTSLSLGNAGFPLTGYEMEAGLWSVNFTTAQAAAVCHNQRLYWGTPGAC